MLYCSSYLTTLHHFLRAPLFVVQTDEWDCSCALPWDPFHADCAVPQVMLHISCADILNATFKITSSTGSNNMLLSGLML